MLFSSFAVLQPINANMKLKLNAKPGLDLNIPQVFRSFCSVLTKHQLETLVKGRCEDVKPNCGRIRCRGY